MPEENKIKKEDPKVDLDTSGPEVDVTLPEDKTEVVTEQEPVKEETVKEVPKEEETVKEIKKEQKTEDTKLEDYSKGVQARIAKLTRKMREAERREAAATEYAQALEYQRRKDQSRFKKMDTDYWGRFEKNVKTGMESAQKELANAIESGNAEAQVEANKRIATLAFENAKLEQSKEAKEQEQPVRLSDGGKLPKQTPQDLPQPDPQAEAWAAKNEWFGKDRAMTFTAFEHHRELVEQEGYDPKSSDYYTEIDKRIRVDFPHKFAKGGDVEQSSKTTNQLVASAQRSVKPGRQTVRLTSSQVAIAKKLGVPLEEYAKQLKLTKEASI